MHARQRRFHKPFALLAPFAPQCDTWRRKDAVLHDVKQSCLISGDCAATTALALSFIDATAARMVSSFMPRAAAVSKRRNLDTEVGPFSLEMTFSSTAAHT